MFLIAPNYQCPLICIISSNFWQIVRQVIGYVFFSKSPFLISHFLFFYKCRMGFKRPRERRLVLGVLILHMFVCFETWFACVDHTDLELCVAQDGL